MEADLYLINQNSKVIHLLAGEDEKFLAWQEPFLIFQESFQGRLVNTRSCCVRQ